MTWRRKPKQGKALWTQLAGGVKPNGSLTASEMIFSKPRRKSKWPRRRSSTLTKRMLLYRSRVRLFLARHCRCAVFPSKRATQVHHVYGRLSKLLFWEPGWRAVNAEGHRWIDANREEARNLGLLAPIGAWNDYDAAVRIEASLGRFRGET